MAYYIPPPVRFDLNEPRKIGNLAEKMEQDDRRKLADFLLQLVGIDEQSMNEWMTEADGYLKNLQGEAANQPQDDEQRGANESAEAPTTSLTLSAIIQFAAGATDALLGEPDLAHASEPGAEPLAEWVSTQLRTADVNWLRDTDPLVIHMAATGLAWRKRTFDDDAQAFHSTWLTSTGEVIINANAKSFDRLPRITQAFERYPYEIQRSIQRRHWIDYDPKFNDDIDPQAPKSFYEVDLWIDLDGDSIDEPWTVTLSRDDTPEVVKIRPRWSKKTIVNTKDELIFKPARRFYPYMFLPDPSGCILPKGFGWLLRKAEGSADRLLALINDTMQSSAQNGGIYGGATNAMPAGGVELKTNRMTFVPTDGAPLQNNMQLFPDKQVSTASVQVLEKLITLGDRLAGTLNMLENAPASMTATLAKGLIDTGSRVQSAVHRRLVMSMTDEMRAFVLMADAYDQLPEGQSASDAGGVAVTADPELATEMHRSALAGIYMELLKDPLTNPIECRMRLYRVLRLPQPEKLLGTPPQQTATPKEQGDIAVKLHEAQTKRMQVMAQIVLLLAQARKTLVEAQAGTVDMRMALLQMAQLENAVQQMMTGGSDGAQSGPDGMAPAAGNPGVAGALPAPQGGAAGDVSSGQPGGPGDAGAGGGLPPFGGAPDGAAGGATGGA